MSDWHIGKARFVQTFSIGKHRWMAPTGAVRSHRNSAEPGHTGLTR